MLKKMMFILLPFFGVSARSSSVTTSRLLACVAVKFFGGMQPLRHARLNGYGCLVHGTPYRWGQAHIFAYIRLVAQLCSIWYVLLHLRVRSHVCVWPLPLVLVKRLELDA